MSQAPRRINTQRSLNRPTEQRPTEAPASRPAPLQGQPDFFEEPSVPHPEQRPRPAAPAHPAPAAGTGGNGGRTPPPRRRSAKPRKKKKRAPMWLPLAVTLAVLAVISGVVVYAAGMINRVEENLKPEENAASLVEEIQTLEEYKGDVVNILVCGIDYELSLIHI